MKNFAFERLGYKLCLRHKTPNCFFPEEMDPLFSPLLLSHTTQSNFSSNPWCRGNHWAVLTCTRGLSFHCLARCPTAPKCQKFKKCSDPAGSGQNKWYRGPRVTLTLSFRCSLQVMSIHFLLCFPQSDHSSHPGSFAGAAQRLYLLLSSINFPMCSLRGAMSLSPLLTTRQ